MSAACRGAWLPIAFVLLLGCARGDATRLVGPAHATTPSPGVAASPLPAERRAPAPEPGIWVSARTGEPPRIDGQVEPIWASAPAAQVPLSWGRNRAEHALDVELRSLHDDRNLYLLARWRGPAPAMRSDVLSNKFTVHFDIADSTPRAHEIRCLVACHTAFADGAGRFVHVSAETIPPGSTDPLPAAGGWDGAQWVLEWMRPLHDANGFDVQFIESGKTYSFFVKVFEGVDGRADPVSPTWRLMLAP